MKQTTQLLLNILQKNEQEAIEHFDELALGDQTEVKYGFDKNSISITFIIRGEQHSQILSMAQKLDRLFDTQTKLDALDQYLQEIENPTKFHFSPYLKINADPEIYATRIGIEHEKMHVDTFSNKQAN